MYINPKRYKIDQWIKITNQSICLTGFNVYFTEISSRVQFVFVFFNRLVICFCLLNAERKLSKLLTCAKTLFLKKRNKKRFLRSFPPQIVLPKTAGIYANFPMPGVISKTYLQVACVTFIVHTHEFVLLYPQYTRIPWAGLYFVYMWYDAPRMMCQCIYCWVAIKCSN